MAIAFVNGVRGGNASASNSIPATAFNLTAGNFAVASFYWDDAGIAPTGPPTDTAGNLWVLSAGPTQIGGGGGMLAQYRCYNALGNASNVVTLALNGSSAYPVFAVRQFSGVATSDPKIATQFGSGNSGSTLACAGSLSHGTGECVMAVLGVEFGASTQFIDTAGSGYSLDAFAVTGDAVLRFGDEYRILSADDTPSMLTSASVVAWGIIAASYGTPAATAAPFFTQLEAQRL